MVPGGAIPLVCATCTNMQSLLNWGVGWLARRPSNLRTSRGGVSSLKARCTPGRGTLPNNLGKVFALRAHCVCTAWALRAHCMHIAAKPTPCHLCITLQSNKANRTHIEPLPTRYVDVPVNISFSVVEYHYAVATTVTLVSAIVITYFIIKELSVHS